MGGGMSAPDLLASIQAPIPMTARERTTTATLTGFGFIMRRRDSHCGRGRATWVRDAHDDEARAPDVPLPVARAPVRVLHNRSPRRHAQGEHVREPLRQV